MSVNHDEGKEIENERMRPHKNDMLKMFYGLNESEEQCSSNLLNIDSPDFHAERYLRKLKQTRISLCHNQSFEAKAKQTLNSEELKEEKCLAELMDTENDMAKQIRTLDSDMQTLVYENYNKFISATDTIRTMKHDFRQMEDEMAKLTHHMKSITQLNTKINTTMQTNRQKIAKLSGVHSLLTKLQFLFELPARLKKCLEMKSYAAAVSYYMKTKAVLQHYQHMESFSGIEKDCCSIINQIIAKLKETFCDKESSSQQLAECVDLLLKLGEPPALLCEEYLQHARQKLDEDLQEMQSYLSGEVGEFGESLSSDPHITMIDVLEFIDRGSNGFLSNMSLTIAAYENLFIKGTDSMITDADPFKPFVSDEIHCVARSKLLKFVENLLRAYFSLVERRLMIDQRSRDNALIVRALDRFYRRLQATTNLLPSLDVMSQGRDIIVRVAKARCSHYKLALGEFLTDCLIDARHIISAPKRLAGKTTEGNFNLLDLVNSTASALLNQVKSVLADIQLFTVRDHNFSSLTYFGREFCCQDVRENIIVHFLHHISETLLSFCNGSSSSPPTLLLLLSRLCRDFEQSTVAYILTLTDEQFVISSKDSVTEVSELTAEIGSTAQKLLESYVQSCGTSVSRMIRTSIEARDWLKCVEPRQVRAVMRRVVEEVSQSDQQVGSLYEEGVRRARSSDSSRRTFNPQTSHSRQRERGHWGAYAPSSTMDNSLLSNIQKLFSERVDVFGPVEFSRASVLTGVVKIALKTLLECVRLKTFGKYGLQQLQVDCHYLQLFLWRFVSDENIVHSLLDEVVSSCVHRCVEPTAMEPSVIEVICERG